MALILVPIMTACLAWLIAWLFVKSLFLNWGKGLEKQIKDFPIESYFPKSTTVEQFDAVLPFIDAKLDHFFTNKLAEKMPIVSMFVGDKTVAQLKAVFIEELQLLFPELVQKFIANAKDNFANQIHSRWKPILEPAILKATKKFRLLAFAIGFVWGILMHLLIHQL
jgi:hypothetical protein